MAEGAPFALYARVGRQVTSNCATVDPCRHPISTCLSPLMCCSRKAALRAQPNGCGSDHLVRAEQRFRRDANAKRIRGLEVVPLARSASPLNCVAASPRGFDPCDRTPIAGIVEGHDFQLTSAERTAHHTGGSLRAPSRLA